MEKENRYMDRSFSDAGGETSGAFSDCNSDRSGEFSSYTSFSLPMTSSSPSSSPPSSSPPSTPRTSSSSGAPPWSSASVASWPSSLHGLLLTSDDRLISDLIASLDSPDLGLQRRSAMELRLLAKHNQKNSLKIAASGAVKPLISLLSSPDPVLKEHATTAILNLSLCDDNKPLIAAAGAIKPLIFILKTGTSVAKENAACALIRLSQIEHQKLVIGRSGAIPHLINLLKTGGPRGRKDASTALYAICSCNENKIRAIEAGIVRPLLDLMADPESGIVDKAAYVLSMVAGAAEGRRAAVVEGGIPVLVEIVEVGTQRQKEIATATLLMICEESLVYRKMVAREGAIPPLVALSQTGTTRAKQKAETLLWYLQEQRQDGASSGMLRGIGYEKSKKIKKPSQQQVQSDSEGVGDDDDDDDDEVVELPNNYVHVQLTQELGHKSDGDIIGCLLQQAETDETSYGEVLNLMEPTSEYKAGSSTSTIASLFSEARFSRCREAPIYGRDDVKKRVIEFLFTDDCMDHNISVIRIVGIGGVGKSTLVKHVYDELIPHAIFEAKAWVCVNERLDINGLTKEILELLTGTACGLTELREVQEAVREELMGKRFLLVLDNVRDDAPSNWSNLLTPLSVGAKGSIILATSRSEKESVMDTTLHYKLDRLSENVSWLVFQQQVFDRRGQKVCSNLMEIGKQIITRCEGLPLAVKAFGGLLQSDLNERSWNAVLESNLWDEDGNLPALRVCCDHLTVHRQQCFQYCSLFPKGYMFGKDHLIRLWMSQGFIENEVGKHGHDLGCKYFSEMLEMSFFQLSPISDPTEKKYIMHDLCHDLAHSLSVNKCLRTETCKLSSIPDAVRHVSLVPSGFDTTLQFASLRELKDIHTLLLINSSIMKWEANVFHVEDPKSLNDLFSHLGCLRTLDLSFTDIEEVPESIVNLQHLCYLALNRTNIRKIPESICSLYNLQTLELQGCNYLSELPAQLKNLTNLQHLDVWKESGFISMPTGIGHLTGLRTLSTFTVGRGEQWCGIRELKDLMNLGGAFCIGGLCNVVNGEEAEVAQLKMKKNLSTLTLQWFNCGEDLEDDQSAGTASEVLQSLQPHNNLEKLTIRDYSGDQFPSWIADPSFLKLMSITLDNCYECNNLPLLGQLPSLKHLSIRMMDGIQRLGHAFCGSGPSWGFQSLETLKLWDMPELEEWWWLGGEDFPCLRSLSISRCDKLKILPRFAHLQELSIHHCAQLPELPTLLCLESLKIEGFQNLESLPQQLDLPALNVLEICNCNQLTWLEGLSHLASLEQLKITRCPKLNFSPNEQLPSMLRVVDIHRGCSLLSKWCPDGFEEIINIHQVRRKLVRQTLPGSPVDSGREINEAAEAEWRL